MKGEILIYDGLQRCPYLNGQVARMPLYRQLGPLSPTETDARFARAERRVGRSLYRTQCPACQACEGIRVITEEFKPSKSQRRVRNRWERLGYRIEMDSARYSDEKLALFNRHKSERGLSDPNEPPMSMQGYVGWLLTSCVQTIEMRYYLEDRLVGVGIVDLGKTAASSVYFYFDPASEVAQLSPGVFSTLQEIEFCKRTNRSHLYLGLYVRDCSRLNYKSVYSPNERLVDGDWRRC